MEDGTIVHSQITASSHYMDYHAWKGRLNGISCWSPSTSPSASDSDSDKNEWLQVDFLSVVTITSIKIQKCSYAEDEYVEYVENLEVATGDLENSLNFIRDDIGIKVVSVKTQYLAFI